MKKKLLNLAAAVTVLTACGPGVPQLGKASLDDVIDAMTVEEQECKVFPATVPS